MEDKKILARLRSRSESAITLMAKRFGNRLYRTAMNILGIHEDAEEAVSDTYLAVWNAIPPTQPDPLAGFVYKTGRNQALDRLRRENAQKRSAYEIPLEELESCLSGATLEDEIDARLLGRAIDRFLDTVPQSSRVLFLRRYWFGDSVKQLARDRGMTPNAVSVQLSRTRQKLRVYLTEEGFLL